MKSVFSVVNVLLHMLQLLKWNYFSSDQSISLSTAANLQFSAIFIQFWGIVMEQRSSQMRKSNNAADEKNDSSSCSFVKK